MSNWMVIRNESGQSCMKLIKNPKVGRLRKWTVIRKVGGHRDAIGEAISLIFEPFKMVKTRVSAYFFN